MFFNAILHFTVLFGTLLSNVGATSRRPNIIIVLADDLGWNDVSFHGSNQIPTPNIDALAYNGIILNSHYVPALCTPSRASLMTGKYPTSMGMQHLVILASEPWGLPLEETLMPQYFKKQGYSTHAIGKWHLGFYKKEYTPVFRGFDSHFGYWNGFQDYYFHTSHSESFKGYDMRRNLDVNYDSQGLYSTDVFTDEAIKIIENHNSTKGPLFLYLSHLAPHSGNPDDPFQAPIEEVSKHNYIKDPGRKIYAAMITKLDESLGKVVSVLKKKKMLDNSIILFMSDNGAATYGLHSNRGSNYPLRGLKESPWEGGVRGAAAIWSPLLNHTKRVSNQLMHMSDWLPTLYSAAGFNKTELGKIDGKDMWNVLSQNLPSPRTEVFNNYDEIENYSSLLVKNWKLIEGTAQEGIADYWFGESGREKYLIYNVTKVLNSETNQAIGSFLKEKPQNLRKGQNDPKPISKKIILELREKSIVKCDYPTFSRILNLNGNHTATNKVLNKSSKSYSKRFQDILEDIKIEKEIIYELEKFYKLFALDSKNNDSVFSSSERKHIGRLYDSGELEKAFTCDPLTRDCLYNLILDPCERMNLADIFPDVVKYMKTRLIELKKSVVRPLNKQEDPLSNPDFYNGTWVNWGDVDHDESFTPILNH